MIYCLSFEESNKKINKEAKVVEGTPTLAGMKIFSSGSTFGGKNFEHHDSSSAFRQVEESVNQSFAMWLEQTNATLAKDGKHVVIIPNTIQFKTAAMPDPRPCTFVANARLSFAYRIEPILADS